MKAVFEEVNGDTAVFLVDDAKKPYFLSVSDLPTDAQPGDVFKVAVGADEKLELLEELPNERRRREQSAKSKREALLKRTQQRNKKE